MLYPVFHVQGFMCSPAGIAHLFYYHNFCIDLQLVVLIFIVFSIILLRRSFSDELNDFLVGTGRVSAADMLENAVPGLRRGFPVGFGHGTAAPDSFRGLENRYRHAVLLSPLVDPTAEAGDHQIELHLQICDGAREVLVPLFPEASSSISIMKSMIIFSRLLARPSSQRASKS